MNDPDFIDSWFVGLWIDDNVQKASNKKILENKNADSAKALLLNHLTTLLKALHPFMPFITEEIWQIMLKSRRSNSKSEVGTPTETSGFRVSAYAEVFLYHSFSTYSFIKVRARSEKAAKTHPLYYVEEMSQPP